MVRAQAIEDGRSADCTLYAGGKVALRSAVFANATTAHGIELDDTHDESLSHPGAVVIPAALAISEKNRLDGKAAIEAIVAGYEAQCRIGSCAGKELYLRGFHPTSTNGVFGAATACAKLLGLNAAQLQSAWGIGLSAASGVMQFSEDPIGTMVKRLHSGLPSQSGVLAAQLAARGYLGPGEAVEGRYGFLRMFAGHSNAERLLRDLGDRYEVEQISVKLYACCRLFHAVIDAVNECRTAGNFEAADVQEAIVFGPEMLYAQHMQYEPDSVMSAQYSLPYTVAATLHLDPRTPEAFGEACYRNPELLRLSRVVSAEHSQELEALSPLKFPGGIRIRLRSGKVLQSTIPDSVGTPMRPLDRSGIISKFQTLTRDRLAENDQADLIECVLRLEREGAMENLLLLLGRE
jgi:2-methylcitrate dehydratase PrpD